jgi:hypothetical protein
VRGMTASPVLPVREVAAAAAEALVPTATGPVAAALPNDDPVVKINSTLRCAGERDLRTHASPEAEDPAFTARVLHWRTVSDDRFRNVVQSSHSCKGVRNGLTVCECVWVGGWVGGWGG